MGGIALYGMAHSVGVNAKLLRNGADLPVFGVEQVTNVSLCFQIEHSVPSTSGIRIDESTPSAANDAAEPTGEHARPSLVPRGRGSRDRQQDPATERGTKGTLIRHADIGSAPAILALTVPMIESSLETLLMATVGEAPLLPIGLLAAQRAAVALSPVAVAADPKQPAASAVSANALT
jgi:hypothetical protein